MWCNTYLLVWYLTLVHDQIYFYQHDWLHRFILCTTPVLSYVEVMRFLILLLICTHTHVYCMCVFLFSKNYLFLCLFDVESNKMLCCFITCSYRFIISHIIRNSNIIIELNVHAKHTKSKNLFFLFINMIQFKNIYNMLYSTNQLNPFNSLQNIQYMWSPRGGT